MPTLNSWAMNGSTSQYLARMTLAWAVEDWGSWRRIPAAWVRHCAEKKMTSCSSVGRELNDLRWYSCSGVARGLVMCDIGALVGVWSRWLKRRRSIHIKGVAG